MEVCAGSGSCFLLGSFRVRLDTRMLAELAAYVCECLKRSDTRTAVNTLVDCGAAEAARGC
eukprot:NODE_28945_length_461_cov_2.700599.p5 GENE.NODE_28945_length_461_cov_2.700599~~NODE_28945_length_461_cov_2.700599.p5  ORF type:complete len:61 (+),score=18.29 NODE_28945_length_461_cov_2.700599:232-414(+)